MNLTEITQLTVNDMTDVNQLILAQLKSDVVLINQLGTYIVNSGGKRVRPMIAILAAHCLGYRGEKHIITAALIEFIHTATLLHDDVVDESQLRRGKATANATFGNAASVLVGDFIYTRSFQMMTELDSLRILKLMAEATNTIAEGEVMQLMNCNNPYITEESYMNVIYSKTARLFEVTTQAIAILASATAEQEEGLKNYGRYLGTAFQLIDDVLDYTANDGELGKNIGDDLQEGKATLPLLHAIKHGSAVQKEVIIQAISQGNSRHLLQPVLNTIMQCGSLEYTYQKAQQEADKAINALESLPQNQFRLALESLAKISVVRKF